MKKDNEKKPKKLLKVLLNLILIIVLLILIAMTAWYIYKTETSKDKEKNTLSYTQLINEIVNKNVEKIEMTVGSTTLKVKLKNEEEEKKAIIPNTQVFMELVQQQTLENNEINLEQKSQSILMQIRE